MKNWKKVLLMLAVLAAMSSVQSVSGQSTQVSKSSAENSPSSDTRASKSDGFSRSENRTPEGVTLTSACNATAEELKASRRLIELLDRENALLRERLDTEKRTTSMLAELNETRKEESEALRNAVAAKSETIAAKDAVIASQEKLIDALKAKKSSPWKRLGDVLIGVAAGMVLR